MMQPEGLDRTKKQIEGLLSDETKNTKVGVTEDLAFKLSQEDKKALICKLVEEVKDDERREIQANIDELVKQRESYSNELLTLQNSIQVAINKAEIDWESNQAYQDLTHLKLELAALQNDIDKKEKELSLEFNSYSLSITKSMNMETKVIKNKIDLIDTQLAVLYGSVQNPSSKVPCCN